MALDSSAPIRDEPTVKPDIGVFLCKCGKNIGASVDVDSVARAVEDLPNVKHIQVNTYTCSEPGNRSGYRGAQAGKNCYCRLFTEAPWAHLAGIAQALRTEPGDGGSRQHSRTVQLGASAR